MNNASETKATRLRSGLLEGARAAAGIKDEAAFARLLNIDVPELHRTQAGGGVSIRALVGLSAAFGGPMRDFLDEQSAIRAAAA